MSIDKRHKSGEMLRRTMDIKCCPIRPLLDEDEMSGFSLIDEQIIGDAKLFLPGLLDQFAVERHDNLDGFRFDEILRDDLEHEVFVLPYIEWWH